MQQMEIIAAKNSTYWRSFDYFNNDSNIGSFETSYDLINSDNFNEIKNVKK